MPKYRLDQDEEFKKRPPKRKPGLFRFRNLFLGTVLMLVVGVAVGVPMALSHRNLVVSTANQYAGIAPFRIDLESIAVGWFSPLRVRNLRLIDQAGGEIVKVADIEMQRGLWSLATNYRDLGTVWMRGTEMHISVQPGTTSIEEALKPWLSTSPSDSDSEASTSAASPMQLPVGRLRIENAVIVARDSVDMSTWQLLVQEADLPLPSADQPIPPVNLAGAIQQLASAQTNGPLAQGRFMIRTQPIAGAAAHASGIPPMQMTIATTEIPLDWYAMLRRRLPELPIERLSGKATLQADIELLAPQDIRAKIATAQIDNLSLVAPELIGKEGASLSQVHLSGTLKMLDNRITAENTLLTTDFGNLGIAASLPTDFAPPTATAPWVPNAQWDIQGNVDLAKLIRVAPGLIPMQNNTQLTRGVATLSSSQTLASGNPKASHRIELGDLVANVSGASMTWENALKASMEIERQNSGQASFNIDCAAEFCQIKGQGDLQAGSLTSRVDLDRLHQRLSRWFALPLSQLSGNADLQIEWKQSAGNRIAAGGSLSTTPMRIGLANGRLNEPAWKGTFEAGATLDGSRILQIDRGSLVLDSESESLKAELQEPLTWTEPAPGAAPLPPAGMTIDVSGDMSAWQKRAQLIAGIDPGIGIEGRLDLKAAGAVDIRHLEITRANFSAQPIVVSSDGFRIREPRVEGTFNGRFDSSDVARLQVEKLEVRGESFALSAKDSAASSGATREGKAAFVVDPKRLMSAMNTNETASSSQNNVVIEGNITGSANWILDPANDIRWQMNVDGKDVRFLQPTPPASSGQGQLASARTGDTMTTLWEEPLTKVGMQGSYQFANGRLDLPETTLQTTWMAYGGATKIESTNGLSKMVSQGRMTYDAAVVAEKLKPWTGDYLQVRGQRTEPVEITWQSSANNNWAESLQAKMQLGWDGASLVGIEIGKADVPLTIENGRFRSKTTIPVSQGALRWDLDSNLASDTIIIRQAPEVVLENVAITPQMCQGWLKYVAPLVADVTSVQGQLSLEIDRAEIVPSDSLKQTVMGQLKVKNVTVGPGPLANQILNLVQQVKLLRKGGTAQPGSPSDAWLQMPEQNIEFAMDKGRVVHRNLKLQAGDILITTDGSVSVDGQLELTANVPILADWVDGTPALAPLAGQSIQVPIGGTIQKPQLDFTAFTSIGKQLAGAAVQGAMQKQIDKGLNKLLGPLESKLAPLQQNIQQNIQQNMPQLPSFPSGFQIPGLPGFGAPATSPPPPNPPIP